MFNKLIDIHNRCKELELSITKKRNEFEDSIAHERTLYSDLAIQENVLREEALLALQKANTNSVEVDGFNVGKRTTTTRKITQLQDLWSFVMKNYDNIVKELGYKDDFDKELFNNEIVAKDKKGIKTLIDNYYNLKGTLPDGTEDVETHFIAISEVK